MDGLKADLGEQGFSLVETHISLVFLGPERVYKVKKPVSLGFLDFSTLAARKAACDAEVSLNRRLAPQVYHGVVPLGRDQDGSWRIGVTPAQEWAVEMTRLRDADSAEARLQRGELTRADIVRVAEHLCRFHEDADTSPRIASFGAREVIERNVRENFEQTRDSGPRYLAADELRAIELFQLRVLRERQEVFAQRAAHGRVRDGHGDLRLEHVYFDVDEGLSIIDCIEFNERFRYADVCADLAFLSMDLEWHQRHDLAEALLASYARQADDYDLYALVDFYESYRAYVRGKVSAMLAEDTGASSAVRERAGRQARKYFLLAEACAREPLDRPTFYITCGYIASGKSTLSNALSELVSAPVIDADRTRKHLAGVGLTTPLHDDPFGGHYTKAATQGVYEELLRRAEVVLGSGRSVILDASFRARRHRVAARELARKLGVHFLVLESVCPQAVCRQRLVGRAQGPSVSDGRLAIFDEFVASFERIEELPQHEHRRLDGTAPFGPQLAALLDSD